VTGESVQAAQRIDALEWQPPEPDQDGVQGRHIVALRAEVAVNRSLALVGQAQLFQVQPRHDVHAAEGRAEMPGPGLADHVQRVDAAGGSEDGGTLNRADLETSDALQLSSRDVDKLGHAGWSSDERPLTTAPLRAQGRGATRLCSFRVSVGSQDDTPEDRGARPSQASTGYGDAVTGGRVASPLDSKYSA
jgi:hypothetical protein